MVESESGLLMSWNKGGGGLPNVNSNGDVLVEECFFELYQYTTRWRSSTIESILS